MRKKLGYTVLTVVMGAGMALATAGTASAAHLTDKNTCKKGGFAEYHDGSGTAFTNQGQCVSFVENGGRLTPVGS